MLKEHRKKLLTEGKIVLTIKVTPKSGHHEIGKIMANGTIKIKLKSPPEDNKANQELIQLLSEQFAIKSSQIQILKGHTSPLKTIEITTPL